MRGWPSCEYVTCPVENVKYNDTIEHIHVYVSEMHRLPALCAYLMD